MATILAAPQLRGYQVGWRIIAVDDMDVIEQGAQFDAITDNQAGQLLSVVDDYADEFPGTYELQVGDSENGWETIASRTVEAKPRGVICTCGCGSFATANVFAGYELVAVNRATGDLPKIVGRFASRQCLADWLGFDGGLIRPNFAAARALLNQRNQRGPFDDAELDAYVDSLENAIDAGEYGDPDPNGETL